MEIKKLEVGSLETNCYILQADDELAVVDPGADLIRPRTNPKEVPS